jgi:hypothetical protein
MDGCNHGTFDWVGLCCVFRRWQQTGGPGCEFRWNLYLNQLWGDLGHKQIVYLALEIRGSLRRWKQAGGSVGRHKHLRIHQFREFVVIEQHSQF